MNKRRPFGRGGKAPSAGKGGIIHDFDLKTAKKIDINQTSSRSTGFLGASAAGLVLRFSGRAASKAIPLGPVSARHHMRKTETDKKRTAVKKHRRESASAPATATATATAPVGVSASVTTKIQRKAAKRRWRPICRRFFRQDGRIRSSAKRPVKLPNCALGPAQKGGSADAGVMILRRLWTSTLLAGAPTKRRRHGAQGTSPSKPGKATKGSQEK